MRRLRLMARLAPAVTAHATVGWIKLNVDGYFMEQTGSAGVGVVIRNNEGEVLLIAWHVLFQCTSADDDH
jgi:hypothetical protein